MIVRWVVAAWRRMLAALHVVSVLVPIEAPKPDYDKIARLERELGIGQPSEPPPLDFTRITWELEQISQEVRKKGGLPTGTMDEYIYNLPRPGGSIAERQQRP